MAINNQIVVYYLNSGYTNIKNFNCVVLLLSEYNIYCDDIYYIIIFHHLFLLYIYYCNKTNCIILLRNGANKLQLPRISEYSPHHTTASQPVN